MFIKNPDQYSLPSYNIGPFTTMDLTTNDTIFKNRQINGKVLKEYILRHFGKNYLLTFNGREAINIALKSYFLKNNDVVSILTTSQNYYISSCVTKEIEKFCTWKREIVPETKVILVNHEFGNIYPDMEQLVSLGIPIIEDCCTSFFSQDKFGKIGKYGDYAVYSFSKFFPIQLGGLIVKNTNNPIPHNTQLSSDLEKYISKIVSFYLSNLDELINKRKEIYLYAINKFNKIGFSERFQFEPRIVPSVLMLRNNKIINDLPALKIHLWAHGIQSSIFYGEDAFFIPIHQNLSHSDVDYFVFVIQNFIETQ